MTEVCRTCYVLTVAIGEDPSELVVVDDCMCEWCVGEVDE